MRVKLLLITGLLLAAGAGLAPAAPVAVEQAMHDFGVQIPKQRKPAPLFTLSQLGGDEVSLSDFRGRLVLLHFWATWCVPCRHEMPLLHALEKSGAHGLQIICVNVDRGNRNKVKTFIDEVTPHFHTLLDPEGSVRNRYAVRGLPTTYLIGRDGKIIGRIIGERDWSSPAMKAMLQLLINRNKPGEQAL